MTQADLMLLETAPEHVIDEALRREGISRRQFQEDMECMKVF